MIANLQTPQYEGEGRERMIANKDGGVLPKSSDWSASRRSTRAAIVPRDALRSALERTSNWLLALAPDLYLYGALLESAPYIKEDGRIQTWGLGFTAAMNDLNNLGLTSAFNAGPMTVRISGPVI